jgi:ATP-dependent RNA helicase DHX29
MERRLSSARPRLELDAAWVERVLDLIATSHVGEGGYLRPLYCTLAMILLYTFLPERRPLEDNEEKSLSKLGVTYGVLRRLGFSEDRVEECLYSITGVDLDEAYEWVSRRASVHPRDRN